jgi:hypothetical protein
MTGARFFISYFERIFSMHTDETLPPAPDVTPRPNEEEIRAVLLRLLRLVAAEVAESLRKRNDAVDTARKGAQHADRKSKL